MPTSPHAADDSRLARLVPLAALPAPLRRQVLDRSREEILVAGASRVLGPGVGAEACYLAAGRLRVHQEGHDPRDLEADTEAARLPLGFPLIAPIRIEALEEARLLHVDRTALDTCLFWTQASQPGTRMARGDTTWIMHLACSPLFARIPPANVQRILQRMERVALAEGDTVVRHGEPGDYYYVVQQGRCAVVRKVPSGEEITVATLEPGDAFGEEALVADSRRNATVRMLSDGALGRLTKADFLDLVKTPVLESLSSAEVARLPDHDALQWLDVRLPEEHRASGLRQSRNIPLDRLRTEAASLERGQRYLVYCDSGRRSAAGAFLLAQQGFDVIHLRGGLLGRASAPVDPAPPAAARLDTNRQVSRLKVALAQADQDLTQAIHRSVEAEVRERTHAQGAAPASGAPGEARGSGQSFSGEASRARQALQEAQQRRKELAMAVAVLEGEAAEELVQLEETQRAQQADADRRLHEGERSLAREYRETAAALAKVHGRRNVLEEQLGKERHRLQAEIEALRARGEELDRQRASLVDSEAKAEEALAALGTRAQHQIEALTQAEQRIRSRGEERMRARRAELEQHFADALALVEHFRREREEIRGEQARALGAARAPGDAPAGDEAGVPDGLPPEEIRRLDEAARKADRELASARQRYSEARAAQGLLTAQARRREQEGAATEASAPDTLDSDLARASGEVQAAQAATAAAEAEHARAEIARQLATASDDERQSMEESMRRRLAAELEDWMRSELAEEEVDHAITVRLQEDLVRVQVQAEAERRAEEEATSRMLAEIRSQLAADRNSPD